MICDRGAGVEEEELQMTAGEPAEKKQPGEVT